MRRSRAGCGSRAQWWQRGGFLALDGHSDVTEDEHDADEAAELVADRGTAVVDEDFASILADENGVIGEGDTGVEALDLGDRVLDGLAAGLADDLEDMLKREAQGFGGGPAGELLGYVVHGLDAAFGIAGNYSIADGLEGGAQLLFGLEGLFGAEAEDVVCLPVGVGDLLQSAAGVEPDDESDDNREDNKTGEGNSDLIPPATDIAVALLAGCYGECDDALADRVHLVLAEQVQVYVGGLGSGMDTCDQGFREGVFPEVMGGFKVVHGSEIGRVGIGGPQLVELNWDRFNGLVVGIEELRVGGGLIATQTGFLVDDKRVEGFGESNRLVGGFDPGNGTISLIYLPGKGAGT